LNLPLHCSPSSATPGEVSTDTIFPFMYMYTSHGDVIFFLVVLESELRASYLLGDFTFVTH
jgi:hypothetical protein